MEEWIDQKFEGINVEEGPFASGLYEQCQFVSCQFNKSDFTDMRFIDCVFRDCDLSMIQVNEAHFQKIKFENCKMIGIHFDEVNPFQFACAFHACLLSLSTMVAMDLRKCTFVQSELIECDFSEADLRGIKFEECNLDRAKFDQTNLEGTDFTQAAHFQIYPESNRIKQARFSRNGLAGLLSSYDIIVED